MKTKPLTACKHYCIAAGATQGNIAYTQSVRLSYNPLFNKSIDPKFKCGNGSFLP